MVTAAPPRAANDLIAARAACVALARRHGENFTVRSWFAPRAQRVHLAVLYAFCRAVDDLGDEGRLPAELVDSLPNPAEAGLERLALLDAFERDLDLAFAGRPRGALFIALAETVQAFGLPRQPFARLIEANRMDQRASRYATYADLLGYCEHSANPVGRLVLALNGYRDEKRARLSDATCTALQLANFWQDIGRDLASGRIYLPQEDMARFGVAEADLLLDAGSEPFRRLIEFEVGRARSLFAEGMRLLDEVSGRLRVDLALFSRGGLAILNKIERQAFDTLAARPTLTGFDKTRIALAALARGGM
jgi:squalene synthase HpnC